MNWKLEDRVSDRKRPNFKSDGEKRIAYFLDNNSIKYQYEPGVLVNSVEDKPRIWYPDFHLPEFGAYIEYYGLAGKKNYDMGIKAKQAVYSKMGMAVVPVYPWMFAANWQKYIVKELHRSTLRRYRKLTNKFYRTQPRPFIKRYNHSSPRKYFGGFNRRY